MKLYLYGVVADVCLRVITMRAEYRTMQLKSELAAAETAASEPPSSPSVVGLSSGSRLVHEL